MALLPIGSSGYPCLDPTKTHTVPLTLFCSPDNQRENLADEEITGLQIAIQFNASSNSPSMGSSGGIPLEYKIRTNIPLHIFLQDHPQNPSAAHESILPISCYDDGPRLTQSAFLSLYQSDFAGSATRQISVGPTVPWKRWYQQAFSTNVLEAIVGKNAMTSPSVVASGILPSAREATKVIELKLSRNRVYVVASREAASNNGHQVPDLVFFISFRVGDGVQENSGHLVVGEARFLANAGDGSSVWERCEITLKSKVNPRMWAGLDRALQSIILS